MIAHGEVRQRQATADFLVRKAFEKQRQNLALPAGEAGHLRAAGLGRAEIDVDMLRAVADAYFQPASSRQGGADSVEDVGLFGFQRQVEEGS